MKGSEAFNFDDIDLDQLDGAEGEKGSRGKPTMALTLKVANEDLGRADGLRHVVLTLVSDEEYDRAIKRMHEFQESKHEYPKFKLRAARYITYGCDLINAIRAKRSFPGMQTLAMAKQQELYDKALAHFNDLTATLRKIESIDREVRAEDFRSTVWVVKATMFGILAILLLAFVREMSRGMIPAAGVVLDDVFNNVTNWIFDTAGF